MENKVALLNELLEKDYYRNYRVKYEQVIKNGVEVEGLVITGINDICPIIYPDEEFWDKSDDEMIDYLDEIVETHTWLGVDMEQFEKDYIFENVLPRLHPQDRAVGFRNHHVFYSRVLDLVVTYHVNVGQFRDSNVSYAVTTGLMEKEDISYEELNVAALGNLRNSSFAKPFSEIVGINPIFGSGLSYNDKMFILSCNEGYYGASVMLCHDILDDLTKGVYEGPAVILPSSVHEVIAIPKNDIPEFDSVTINNIISDINSTMLNNEEVLSEHYYIYDKGEYTMWQNEVTI